MKIVIACGSMSFGPQTLATQSLGGSETAALMLGKELAKRGHTVIHFCNLPPRERPDYWPGGKADDGVTYVSIESYQGYAATATSDLTIIVRDPKLASFPAMTRKKVLWMHDIATKRGMQRAFDAMSWCIDQVWTVSEWHRKQVHEATGYPLDNIVALRNGIVPIETMKGPRLEKQLVYAARPERGLDNLIMPGGVMEHLPDYNLVVCMYDHFPEHMRGYYEQVFARMKAMPNVTYLGPKPQAELRQIIRDSAAYIYPTQFEETSCILARECMEQRTPFITTEVGALPETLGAEGIYFEQWLGSTQTFFMENMPKDGTPAWCKLFAEFARECLENKDLLAHVSADMETRADLYWDGVAELVEQNAYPKGTTIFSRAWSLVQDGDVIAAKTYLEHAHDYCPPETWTPALRRLWSEIATQYPFLLSKDSPGYLSMAEFYEWVYAHKEDREDSELVFRTDCMSPRIAAIADEVAKLPAGSCVLEYGCGPGHLLAALATRFPHIDFVGVEISPAAVRCLNEGAMQAKMDNLVAYCGDTENWPKGVVRDYDAAIISEVLEHVIEPWKVEQAVEAHVKPGGRMIVTTPFGSWEQATIKQPGKWGERAHIWHLDGDALMKMFGNKKSISLLAMPVGGDQFGRPIGNSICAFDVGLAVSEELDPWAKAHQHIPRQTVCACVIAMNDEDTIQRMLNSIEHQVQHIQVALGPSTDRTRQIIETWALDHPWVGVTIYDAPKIEPYKFGFDQARNMSVYGPGDHGFDSSIRDFDWFIWIDTDEYLSGNFSPYLRNSDVQGYIVPQHHFTVEPRGGAVQIDRPARLLRVDAGYRARGHIHEHFQLADGVGRVWMLPDVDLGHTGYVNEEVRKKRFARNFEFLKWDHEDVPPGLQQKLHHFLWFRDIVHRLRLLIQRRDMEGARKLAEEGLSYYNEHWKDMLTFGQGLHMSLAYVSEIRNYMGKGVPVKVALGFDGKTAQFEGRFEDYDELERLMKSAVEPEFSDRNSRYY